MGNQQDLLGTVASLWGGTGTNSGTGTGTGADILEARSQLEHTQEPEGGSGTIFTIDAGEREDTQEPAWSLAVPKTKQMPLSLADLS